MEPRVFDDEADARVTELFDAYREATDNGDTPDADAFLSRVRGEEREELHRRIRMFESLQTLSKDMARHPSPGQESDRPRRVGRFEVRTSLGRGGLGHVYLAHDPSLERMVAVKVLDRGLVPDRHERAWVLNEARSLALLEHPGVVRVYEVGSADGFDFVSMEHLTGPSLAEVVRELRRLVHEEGGLVENRRRSARELALALRPIEARIVCFHRIASALAYCHNRGVIHRDIKPENVVFDHAGNPKLIDFGLAHLEGSEGEARPGITGRLVGTAAYIAPEQVASSQTGTDPRSDQFSLATLFYEVLTLDNPFEAATPAQTSAAVLRCEPATLRRRCPEAPLDLATLVHHGLQREPDARYPTVQAMADDIGAILNHRPISVEEPSWHRRLLLWARRNRGRVVASAVGVALFLVAGLTLWVLSVLARRNDIAVEALELELASFDGTADFFESGRTLDRLMASAESFDASFGRFGLRVTPDVEEVVHSWSRRLGDAFEAAPLHEENLEWRLIFGLEEAICPECPDNVAERRRGIVELPLEELEGRRWELFNVVPGPTEASMLFVHLEPYAPIARLPLGSYRLLVYDAEDEPPVFEAAFGVFRPWKPARRIELIEREPDAFYDAVDVAPRTITAPDGSEVAMPAFRISPELVTTGAFRRFLSSEAYARYLTESGRSNCEFDELRAHDEPAWVDIDVAMAYARSLGGRLPSVEEIVAAADDRAIELPDHLGSREWTSSVPWETNPWNGRHFPHTSYRRGNPSLGMGITSGTRYQIPLEAGQGIGFRIAYSVDAFAAYHGAD
jgi:serine/threonine protein kinase